MKSGLDYFPLECVLDYKFELIEAEYGLQGFAVIVKLFQRIYGSDGYYCEFTNDVGLLFAKKNNVGYNLVSEIVRASVSRGIFDSRLFEKYGILTSTGIQKRYFEACNRRQKVTVKKQYLLLDDTQIPENVCILSENVDIPSENVNIEKQSKESKVKYSKERYPHGIHKNVFLSDEELEKLRVEYPLDWQKKIDYLSGYMESKGKQYKSHYATIRHWAKQDADKARGNSTFDTEKYDREMLKGPKLRKGI